MAYDYKKLVGTSAHIAPEAPVHYDYNLKAAEDITTAGYFPAESGIKEGDIITKNLYAVSAAGAVTGLTQTKYVAKVAEGVITLVALS
jgi:hypothetical protein